MFQQPDTARLTSVLYIEPRRAVHEYGSHVGSTCMLPRVCRSNKRFTLAIHSTTADAAEMDEPEACYYLAWIYIYGDEVR